MYATGGRQQCAARAVVEGSDADVDGTTSHRGRKADSLYGIRQLLPTWKNLNGAARDRDSDRPC